MQPTPPPEAGLITAALKRSSLSQRKAASIAGISEAYWRRIIAGHNRGIPVNVDPVLIARMAHAVSLTPEEIENYGGRDEVAHELRQLLRLDERDYGQSLRIIEAVTEGMTAEEVDELFRRASEQRKRKEGEGGDGQDRGIA